MIKISFIFNEGDFPSLRIPLLTDIDTFVRVKCRLDINLCAFDFLQLWVTFSAWLATALICHNHEMNSPRSIGTKSAFNKKKIFFRSFIKVNLNAPQRSPFSFSLVRRFSFSQVSHSSLFKFCVLFVVLFSSSLISKSAFHSQIEFQETHSGGLSDFCFDK